MLLRRIHRSLAFFTIIVSLLLLPQLLPAVAGQGYSFDTAETITGSKYNVYINIDFPEHFYRYNSPGNVRVCAKAKTSGLDIDLYIYDSNRNLLGASISAWNIEECLDVQRSGLIYIVVKLWSGSPTKSGLYDLIITVTATATTPTTTPTTTTPTTTTTQATTAPSESGSGGCPCPGVPFQCSCSLFGWDPCAGLANVYCAITGLGHAIQQFFRGIWENINNAINSVVQFFQDLFGSISNAIISFFKGVAEFLTSIPKAIAEFFGSLWHGITSAFSSFVQAVGVSWNISFGAMGAAGDWLGQNWPYILGIIVMIIGFVFGLPPLVVLGVLIMVGYAFTQGVISWQMVLLAIGAIIIIFAVSRD